MFDGLIGRIMVCKAHCGPAFWHHRDYTTALSASSGQELCWQPWWYISLSLHAFPCLLLMNPTSTTLLVTHRPMTKDQGTLPRREESKGALFARVHRPAHAPNPRGGLNQVPGYSYCRTASNLIKHRIRQLGFLHNRFRIRIPKCEPCTSE